MLSLRHLLITLALPLLAVAAAAQVLDVRPVEVAGGTQILLTSLDASGLSTTSVLLPPGGVASAQSSGSSLDGAAGSIEAGPQRFYSRWFDLFGSQHLVVTQKLLKESHDEHAERHEVALEIVLQQYPAAQGTTDWLPWGYYTPADATDTFCATWKGIDGLEHAVITVKKPGESVPKWVERHASAIEALKARFPALPGG